MASPRDSEAQSAKLLRGVLGAQPPATIARLSRVDLEDLAAAIEAAKRQHSAALSAALNAAFEQVPGLLRGAVRRVVLR